MEILLIPLVLLLLIGFFVALASGRTPGRRDRGRTRDASGGPAVERDPGLGRPAGPGAESQRAGDAGTLHPPGQSSDDGPPDAVPPYEAKGKTSGHAEEPRRD